MELMIQAMTSTARNKERRHKEIGGVGSCELWMMRRMMELVRDVFVFI